MDDVVSQKARRRFLKLAAAGVAIAPLGGGLIARRARAQEKVTETDELAQQLGYKEDATKVDKSQWPDYAQGHMCANCALFHGENGAADGPCDIFGGKLVHAKGWCMSWVEREA